MSKLKIKLYVTLAYSLRLLLFCPNKKKNGFFRRQLDPLSDDPHELGHCDVRRDQILPLVNVHNL